MTRDLPPLHTLRDAYLPVLWPLALMATITSFSSQSGPQVPWVNWIPAHDKIAHFFVFGLLATHLLRLRREARKTRTGASFAVLMTLLFSVSDELHQFANPHRFFELADIVADLLGAITAVIAYRSWVGYRNLLERQIIRFTLMRKNSGISIHRDD